MPGIEEYNAGIAELIRELNPEEFNKKFEQLLFSAEEPSVFEQHKKLFNSNPYILTYLRCVYIYEELAEKTERNVNKLILLTIAMECRVKPLLRDLFKQDRRVAGLSHALFYATHVQARLCCKLGEIWKALAEDKISLNDLLQSNTLAGDLPGAASAIGYLMKHANTEFLRNAHANFLQARSAYQEFYRFYKVDAQDASDEAYFSFCKGLHENLKALDSLAPIARFAEVQVACYLCEKALAKQQDQPLNANLTDPQQDIRPFLLLGVYLNDQPDHSHYNELTWQCDLTSLKKALKTFIKKGVDRGKTIQAEMQTRKRNHDDMEGADAAAALVDSPAKLMRLDMLSLLKQHSSQPVPRTSLPALLASHPALLTRKDPMFTDAPSSLSSQVASPLSDLFPSAENPSESLVDDDDDDSSLFSGVRPH